MQHFQNGTHHLSLAKGCPSTQLSKQKRALIPDPSFLLTSPVSSEAVIPVPDAAELAALPQPTAITQFSASSATTW